MDNDIKNRGSSYIEHFKVSLHSSKTFSYNGSGLQQVCGFETSMNCCSDERDNKRSPIPTSSSFTPSLVTTVITDVVSHVPAAFGGDGKQLSRTRRKDTDHEQQRRKQKRPVAAAAGYRRVEQPWRHVGGSSERTPPLPAPNGQDEEKKKGRRQPEYDLFPLQARGRQTGDNGVAQVAGCRRRSSESSVMAQLSRPPFSQSSPTTCASSSAKVNTFFGSCDDSRYWDYAFRPTNKGDMGHLCRECKRPFSELNAVMAVRR